MKQLSQIKTVLASVLLACLPVPSARAGLEADFLRPPDLAKPWVYWFWLNGNISETGITKDLEAMKRVGIGGVLIMEVDQGAPVGPADFMGARWRELFKHVQAEALRLGLEVNMNNDAGWNGSGGPWIRPAEAMQEVVWTETAAAGPAEFSAKLSQPAARGAYYRDIAVQAFPATGDYRLPDLLAQASYQNHTPLMDSKAEFSPEMEIPQDKVIDLTARLAADGTLTWQVPEGKWTIARFGHTLTGAVNAPAPATGRGLECDKLSPRGIEAHFAGMMAKLVADNPGGHEPGRAGLSATHIDSWENGRQNWTEGMREEFQRRRGYDMMPYFPVMTGRVVGNLAISTRFLWDLRQTVSEMIIENYAGRMRALAHAAGLRFTTEGYFAPCDSIPYAGQADEPIGEFWTPAASYIESCRAMASAGHLYGRRIIGAEAFTSGSQERWREHPGILKTLGDRAFCEGINRFIFHRYALQPWERDYAPGMTMGPWGQHYERTQTWWEWTPGWHEYLARCQYLLRQGTPVADICYVQPERPPYVSGDHPRIGYAWDECTTRELVDLMAVKDGRLVTPSGMSYGVLVLPPVETMTPILLRRARELADAGATLVASTRPDSSPSLVGYPQCDDEVRQIAAELWGDIDGQSVLENRIGKGRLVWSNSPEKVLEEAGTPADFSGDASLLFFHRRDADTDFYFVSNQENGHVTTTCSFRATGRVPELWWPMSGHIEPAPVWQERGGRTHVSLALEPGGSVFVVFRQPAGDVDPVVRLTLDGKPLFDVGQSSALEIKVSAARYGVLEDPARTRDVAAVVQARLDSGTRSFQVREMAGHDDPAYQVVKTLEIEYTINGRPFHLRGQDPDIVQFLPGLPRIEVRRASYGVPGDPARTRDRRAMVQRLADSGRDSFPVSLLAEDEDPAFNVVKTLDLDVLIGGEERHFSATDPETIHLSPAAAPPPARLGLIDGKLTLLATRGGDYHLTTASGASRSQTVATPTPAIEQIGPWQVRFEPGRGAPEEARFDSLTPWNTNPDPGIRHFSGMATYTATIGSPDFAPGDRHHTLDLGQVHIMARVKLNGKDLGVLWKAPYRMDVTHAIQPGENRLEIQVVNLWPNRLIGDEMLPEDSERNPNGTLKSWPDWVLKNQPSPTGRHTFTTWHLWGQDEAPLPSGLLGPVTLLPTEVLEFD